ncbi:hypothetical protein [Falsiroseomonas oryzae]|uniref:hypothetical protein n=1 Tax=Falsiroseomonas oryzae TaxID=2766473 RepID=UPI0022EA8383|nr:hypothetical protein [Roseomonas sp. MO-31]
MLIRIMFWNTLGGAIPPSFALNLAYQAGADVFCVAEPAGAFDRVTSPNFEKVTLGGRRRMYVFHNESLELVLARTNDIGKSGEAGFVQFKDGNDQIGIGFCHAQFTSGRLDGTHTADWMASFESWLKGLGADLYVGDTNMGSLGTVRSSHPRSANSNTILGDRPTTDGGMPYDKGKILDRRITVDAAGVILPESRRPPPSDGDMDDDKDARGNFYIPMNSNQETIYRQSNHRPIYVDITFEGTG